MKPGKYRAPLKTPARRHDGSLAAYLRCETLSGLQGKAPDTQPASHGLCDIHKVFLRFSPSICGKIARRATRPEFLEVPYNAFAAYVVDPFRGHRVEMLPSSVPALFVKHALIIIPFRAYAGSSACPIRKRWDPQCEGMRVRGVIDMDVRRCSDISGGDQHERVTAGHTRDNAVPADGCDCRGQGAIGDRAFRSGFLKVFVQVKRVLDIDLRVRSVRKRRDRVRDLPGNLNVFALFLRTGASQ